MDDPGLSITIMEVAIRGRGDTRLVMWQSFLKLGSLVIFFSLPFVHTQNFPN